MANPATNNPNATAATVSGATAVVLVYLQGIFGLDVPVEVAAAETTLVIALVLFIGRLWPKRQ
jgi:hypothetical protein